MEQTVKFTYFRETIYNYLFKVSPLLSGSSCLCCGGFTFTNSLGDNHLAENDGKTLLILVCFGYVPFKNLCFRQEVFGRGELEQNSYFLFSLSHSYRMA